MLFQPLAQSAERVRSSPQSGAGLGLALSRSLARALGGDLVLLSSVEGQGSAFRITVSTVLAVSPTSREFALPGGATLRLSADTVSSLRRVFIHFGQGEDRRTAQRALESIGATVRSSHTATHASAVDAVDASANLPAPDPTQMLDSDTIIVDGDAAGVDIPALLKALRTMSYKGRMIVASHSVPDLRRIQALGVDAVISKPLDVLALFRAVSAPRPQTTPPGSKP
jgi:CheY-like chemotaxis protein